MQNAFRLIVVLYINWINDLVVLDVLIVEVGRSMDL